MIRIRTHHRCRRCATRTRVGYRLSLLCSRCRVAVSLEKLAIKLSKEAQQHG